MLDYVVDGLTVLVLYAEGVEWTDLATPEQVAAFVDRFMPAYRCYLPGLYERGPTTARAGHLLVVEVDEGRDPVAAQPDPIM